MDVEKEVERVLNEFGYSGDDLLMHINTGSVAPASEWVLDFIECDEEEQEHFDMAHLVHVEKHDGVYKEKQ